MKASPTLAEVRRKPHWSYSSINTFLNICSLQWAFRYVYKEEPLFVPSVLVLGRAFHAVCTLVCVQRLKGESPQIENALDCFSDLVAQECRTSEPELRFAEGESGDTMSELGRRMLSAFIPELEDRDSIAAVAQAFSVPLVDADGNELSKPLVGEFDLVIELDGHPVVVDWKTSARRWPESKVRLDLQPTCYLYAHGRSADTEDAATFRFDIVTKTKTAVVERYCTTRDANHFQRLVETVRVMDEMARAEHFLPNDQSWACRGCPYALACESWHRERSRSHHSFKLVA